MEQKDDELWFMCAMHSLVGSYTVRIWVITLPLRGVWHIVKSVYVIVCLAFHLHISKTTYMAELGQIFCAYWLWLWFCPPLEALWYVMYLRFCGWLHYTAFVNGLFFQDNLGKLAPEKQNQCFLPSVLWRCWVGGRKGIWPVKNWVVGCWYGYLSGTRCRFAYAQLMPLPFTVSCSSKSRLVFTFLVIPFWYRFTRVVPDTVQGTVKWL